MTIKRTINGTEIEFTLTNEELRNAYDEFEHKDDITIVNLYGEVPSNKIDEVAYRYRKLYDRYLDDDSDVRYDCVKDAMWEVLGNDD